MNVLDVLCVFAISAVTNNAWGVAAQMYACPDGWKHFDGSCYLFEDKLKTDWTQATLHCASLSSNLVIIESRAEDVFLQGHSNKLFKPPIRASKNFWVGATDAVTEGSWRWYNRPIGSHLTYSNWAFGQPNVWKPNFVDEDCLCLFGYANFQWHDVNCGEKGHFICEFKLPRTCPEGWENFKGSCYLFNDKLNKDWTHAKQHCADLRSNLVTIESKAEDVFLQGRSNAIFKPPIRASKNFWVGATDAVTEGKWRWYNRPIDSHLSYSNWAPGQPNVWRPNFVDEDCLCLFGYANFQWHDVSCGSKGPFICEMRLAE